MYFAAIKNDGDSGQNASKLQTLSSSVKFRERIGEMSEWFCKV